MRTSVVVARGHSSCGARALEHRLSSCGARASLLRGVWDLPGPGLEPMSPALASGFLTSAPPGKSLYYLFLAALGLRCCAWAFFSCGEWGLLFVVVHGLLIAVASLVVEHRL